MDMLVRGRLDELAAPKRNHYFYGKLLDEMHLRLEQDYFNGKRSLLNRLALGSGVLCGLQITPENKLVRVSPGVAIDGFGREIIVPEEVRVDLSRVSVDCCTVRERKPDEKTLYLKVCYRECKADFEPVLVSDCLPQQQCAPSTIVESYCLEVSLEPPVAVAHNEALCKALQEGKTPEEKRALVDIALGAPCAKVAGNGCIGLATLHLDDDGKIVDARFDPPPHVYGNAVLFDMLLCLGGGGKGDPGTGLDQDLPKILDIGWEHDNATPYYLHEVVPDTTGPAAATKTIPGSLLRTFFDQNDYADIETLKKRVLSGDNPPLFTVYFNREVQGIGPQTFTLRLRFELLVPNAAGTVGRPGIYLEFPIVGDVQTVTPAVGSTVKTPHTSEQFAFAATFVPSQTFLASLLEVVLAIALVSSLATDNATLAVATLNVEIKGDFVTAAKQGDAREAEHQVLDADNIGGWVGTNHLRDTGFIHGGRNPSGNLTQGGDFESWVRVAHTLRVAGAKEPPIKTNRAEDLSRMMRSAPESLPVNVNVASRAQLEDAGFSDAQAARILDARRTRWFSNDKDLIARAKVSGTALRSVANKLILV
ncbi:MAG: hypothetical protein WDO56_07820 [Gammaproteobacteria bacterium]